MYMPFLSLDGESDGFRIAGSSLSNIGCIIIRCEVNVFHFNPSAVEGCLPTPGMGKGERKVNPRKTTDFCRNGACDFRRKICARYLLVTSRPGNVLLTFR